MMCESKITVKMMDSKELKELKNMIEDELLFRVNIGKEIEDLDTDKNMWLSAEEWSTICNATTGLKENDAKTKENSERS